MAQTSPDAEQNQSDKFKALTREVEVDPTEKAWDERPRKIATQQPASDPQKPR